MGHNLTKSMKEDGIGKSKVFLACISKTYENSENCMVTELQYAKNIKKPILTLVLEKNVFDWAGKNTKKGNIKELCEINGQGKLFIDISDVCTPSFDWFKDKLKELKAKYVSDPSKQPQSNDAEIKENIELSLELQGQLNLKLGALSRLLRHRHLQCIPSLVPLNVEQG